MSGLIQQYPLFCVLTAFVVGGWLGFFAAALCVAARDADARIVAETEARPTLLDRQAS